MFTVNFFCKLFEVRVAIYNNFFSSVCGQYKSRPVIGNRGQLVIFKTTLTFSLINIAICN